jgi:hypothetical protein
VIAVDCNSGAATGRPPNRSPSASACLVHGDTIELGLARGHNAKAIWRDLVDTCGFAAGYQSVCSFTVKWRAGDGAAFAGRSLISITSLLTTDAGGCISYYSRITSRPHAAAR